MFWQVIAPLHSVADGADDSSVCAWSVLVDFTADFRLNLHIYLQLLAGIKMVVLPLPYPLMRSIEQPARPQKPHTNPRSYLRI